ncbi:MAG: MerR family DNA-binding transcriptional regulator [Rubritepida sp.]|jgi:DNA-binding transcriptional MerR regulator|nr:MerR family DNA-binding transcriptional regulator [Rubritepida sp.]MCU0945452.1 MerR family DNA-binding transcriptional regulator [Rubritepida sp.]
MEQAAPAAPELFTIQQLAEELGVTQRAIRFYETKGLLKPQRVGTMRVFGRRDRARLQLILRGIRLGFTLAEVREYLDLYDADPTQREQMRLLLARVTARIAALEAQRRDLDQALAELQDIVAQVQRTLDQPTRTAGARRPGK